MHKPNIAAFHGDLKSISGDKLDSLHLFMTKLSDGISLMLAPDCRSNQFMTILGARGYWRKYGNMIGNPVTTYCVKFT